MYISQLQKLSHADRRYIDSANPSDMSTMTYELDWNIDSVINGACTVHPLDILITGTGTLGLIRRSLVISTDTMRVVENYAYTK